MTTATAVWLGAAILHTENKDRDSFRRQEIFNKIRDEDLVQTSYGTLMTHITHHCVANTNPNPNTHRKLYRVSAGRYRLYKDGDDYDVSREGGQSVPSVNEVPANFRYLIEWYNSEYNTGSKLDKPKYTNPASTLIEEGNKVKIPDNVPIFLSHSSKDKQIAGEIKNKLDPLDIGVFLAHDDIEGGEDWEKVIHSEIKDCEIFIVLLSTNYHIAEFTDQELGMALAHEKHIIPISIDGKTPYGFMGKTQCMKFKSVIDNENIKELLKFIIDHSNSGKKSLDKLINKLSFSASFIEAILYSENLLLYPKFTKDQINKIAVALITNHQISNSYATTHIMKILRANQRLIDPNLKKDIEF